MLKGLFKTNKIISVGGRFLARYIKWACRSSTITHIPADLEQRIRANAPVIFAFWHGQFLLTADISPKGLPVKVMVARHNDAEIISEMLKHFDMQLLRGAGAGQRKKDRGGASALRGALRAMQEGYSISLTADIPPGPARTAGKGIIALARLSGRPIIPTAIASSRYWAFNSWNRFILNLPYSKIAVLAGDPIWVASTADNIAAEQARLEVEDMLNTLTQKAYETIGADPKVVLPNHAGPTLKLYQTLTRMLKPVAGTILDRRTRRGKEDFSRRNERLGQPRIPRPDGQLCWFHAASVGETIAILELIEVLRKSYSELSILITTGTVTSARLTENRLSDKVIHQYVPMDNKDFVNQFLEHWHPELAIFVESEIWPNLVLATKQRHIPLILVNGRMSYSSYRRWRKFPGLARPLFSSFDLVLAQNDSFATQFLKMGAPRALPVGNLKLDSLPPPVNKSILAELRKIIRPRRVVFAASTHPGEEVQIAAAHAELVKSFENLLTFIAPRHPERGDDIVKMLQDRSFNVAQRSKFQLPDTDTDIYVADTIGELGLFYSLSNISFIGGSLIPHGGQNPIEAIKLKSAVIVGPSRHNFSDIYQKLIDNRGCVLVTEQSLVPQLRSLLENKEIINELQKNAETVIKDMSGALELTLDYIKPFLDDYSRLSNSRELKRVI